jgi:dTDP-4-dehydrorhamnose 3,5-epimerase-like enzyme
MITGKVRQTVYDLPEQNHTYGKKVKDDPDPIKYVVNGW